MLHQCETAKILPSGENALLFKTSQWHGCTRLFAFYRTVVAIGLLVWVLADYSCETAREYNYIWEIWFVYATNWAFVLLAISSIFQLYFCLANMTQFRTIAKEAVWDERVSEMRWPEKCFWVLYTVVTNSALVVSISYWVYMLSVPAAGLGFIGMMSKLKHSLNTVYVLVDLLVVAIPVRILHFVYPLSVGGAFVLFNVTYYSLGGPGPDHQHYTYFVLNWTDPSQALNTVVVQMLLCFLVQFLLYFWYILRMFIYKKVYPESSVGLDESEEETQRIVARWDTQYKAIDLPDLASPAK